MSSRARWIQHAHQSVIRLGKRESKAEEIKASGGGYFFRRVEIPVPQFRQDDERWHSDLLDPTRKAAEFEPERAWKSYEDLPTYHLIHANLIAGKDGFDYLTRNPGAGATKGLYPLREYGSKIEALRFYKKL